MTTEDDFQRALDANPEDAQTRLVFADWLDERGDPRGPGYRALGAKGRVPYQPHAPRDGWTFGDYSCRDSDRSDLPADWFQELFYLTPSDGQEDHGRGRSWVRRMTRREAEDDAALAFAKLPPERRAKLLGLVATG